GSLTTTRHSSAPGQPISKRRPNAYRLKPLISPDEREALWEGLRQKHGAQQFQTARELAGTIRRPNDYETVEALLRHIVDDLRIYNRVLSEEELTTWQNRISYTNSWSLSALTRRKLRMNVRPDNTILDMTT
ncbi:MAG: hypothetical protein HN919_21275, partial [Verrucomicrobia bacterium]|nr:hypothetical protein [Verrucomicrobiota bacterium]